MNYFNYTGFPTKLSGIVLEQSDQEDGKFSIYLKDSKMRVIGCGIYKPSITADNLDYKDGLRIQRIIQNCEGFNEIDSKKCLFILLSDEHYYILDMHSKNPTQIKERNIDVLYDKINSWIKSTNEIEINAQINKINDMVKTTDECKNIIQERDLLINNLNQKIRILESYQDDANRVREEKLELEKKIKTDYGRNIIAIEELKSVFNDLQIERLTRRPFLYGNDEELLITTINGGKTYKSSLVEICINKTRMDTELIIRTEFDHYQYINESDMPSGYYPDSLLYNDMGKTSYYLINEKGEEQKYYPKSNLYDEYAIILFTSEL